MTTCTRCHATVGPGEYIRHPDTGAPVCLDCLDAGLAVALLGRDVAEDVLGRDVYILPDDDTIGEVLP